MGKKVLNEIDLEDILGKIDYQPATNIVLDAYHQQGYFGGDFESAHFTSTKDSIVFEQPYYTQFMLFGRMPGRMPPIDPIINWTKKYGISINPWIIAKHIADNGTNGNDFISPVIPRVSNYISGEIQKLIVDQIVNK